MHPAPPAALELAQRLRQLRESRPRLTQKKLAMAFGTEEKLASATVSSWESLTSPKPPPRHRILAYARFFCTARSTADKPTLFKLEELTADEKRACEKLETELLRLRGAVSGESAEDEATFHRSWHFPDAGLVTIICAQLPSDQTGPLGDPSNPNYTELQTYADIDALIELFGHIRAENPSATVHFRTPPEVTTDDLMGHLIVLGGVVWNVITERLSKMANLPVRQVTDAQLDSGDIFIAEVDGEQRQFWPKFAGVDKQVLAEDVGLLARVPNPLISSRTLTICNGIHSRGVYGAVRTLTHKDLRATNERYISAKFGDAESFVILMSIKVINNEAITPDFNSPDVVLYDWAPDAG
jgi:transcriptional regulator with XRE-family HTH domain